MATTTQLAPGAQDDLSCGLVSGMTVLDARSAGITSLMGIENLTGLTILLLSNGTVSPLTNSITDIGALSGLTSLGDAVFGQDPGTSPSSNLCWTTQDLAWATQST